MFLRLSFSVFLLFVFVNKLPVFDFLGLFEWLDEYDEGLNEWLNRLRQDRGVLNENPD